MAKATKSSEGPRSAIKKEQWEMPVSFDEAGRMVSLREYVEGDHKALAFSSLSPDQRAEIAAKRIEMEPDYEMASMALESSAKSVLWTKSVHRRSWVVGWHKSRPASSCT